MDANERRARATQEAIQWWSRLSVERSTELSKGERELFTQWLRESPSHVAELLRIAHVHDSLARFKLWAEIEVAESAEPDNVIPLRAAQEMADSASMRRPRVARWALAASVCVIAILTGWWVLGTGDELIETELAERRQVMLDDGSVIQLEPQTTLRVRLQSSSRQIALERGRALFRVAKDAHRPFWVSVDQTSVRAVGTAFGVERSRQGIVITVAEGTVAVRRGLREEHRLGAGQQLTVQSSVAADRVRTVDTSRALAWAQGQLIFENDELVDVVAVFNRYNRTQLRIDDRQLATRRVSGVFEATDMETLLAFIRQGSSDIRVTQTDQGVVIVSRGPSAALDGSTVQ